MESRRCFSSWLSRLFWGTLLFLRFLQSNPLTNCQKVPHLAILVEDRMCCALEKVRAQKRRMENIHVQGAHDIVSNCSWHCFTTCTALSLFHLLFAVKIMCATSPKSSPKNHEVTRWWVKRLKVPKRPCGKGGSVSKNILDVDGCNWRSWECRMKTGYKVVLLSLSL